MELKDAKDSLYKCCMILLNSGIELSELQQKFMNEYEEKKAS